MPLTLILIIITVVVISRIIAGFMDDGRIQSYLNSMSCTLLEKHWEPFGPGWFGEKNSRIYQISYRDSEGNIHQAHAKTSMLSGVYLTNDFIVERKQPDQTPQEDIEEEKARLRRRLAILEQQNPE